MKRTRWPILTLTLSLTAALAIPTAGFAHGLELTSAAFNGYNLQAGADTNGPVQHFEVDVYKGSFKFEGQKGKPAEGTMVNAFTVLEDWWVNNDETCTIWQETWEAQSKFWVEDHDGAMFSFTSPYDGSMSVDLHMHGVRSTYENHPYTEGQEWCGWNEEPPTSTEHLGQALLTVEASWDSVANNSDKGKKQRGESVTTTVTFDAVTFGGETLGIVFSNDPHRLSPHARSGSTRLSIPHLNFSNIHN